MGGLYFDLLETVENIQKGDVVYVVSDVLELAKAVKLSGGKFQKDELIDAIVNKVGAEGTVLFPTFNWDFCTGKPFDYYHTVSMTGALTSAALMRADFKRTRHPIYSFAVWGRDKELLFGMEHTNSFGEGSIFDYLYKKNAKALVIGLPTMAGLTFCHHVEQMIGVPYRYEKEFTAEYIDWNQVKSVKTYSMYVRDLEKDPKPRQLFEPLGMILEQLNISRTAWLLGIPFRVVLLREMYIVEELDIRLNDSRNLYTYIGQKESGE